MPAAGKLRAELDAAMHRKRDSDFAAALVPHPTGASGPLHAVTITASLLDDGRLHVAYALEGDLATLQFPRRKAVSRQRDELWKHTCFELFIAEPRGSGYLEYNFSPAGDWAAYSFESYRFGRSALKQHPAPRGPTISRSPTRYVVDLRIDPVPDRRMQGALVNFAVIAEDLEGELSYWALSHPVAKPDFHDRAAFRILFPPD